MCSFVRLPISNFRQLAWPDVTIVLCSQFRCDKLNSIESDKTSKSFCRCVIRYIFTEKVQFS